MRTTLSLDEDVAARLEQLRRAQARPYKDIVNEALRAGLEAMATGRQEARSEYHTPSVSLGGSLVGALDNVQETLSVVESDNRR